MMLENIQNERALVQGALPLLCTVIFYYLYVYLFRSRAILDVPVEGYFKPGQGANSTAANTLENLTTYYRKHRNRIFKLKEPFGEMIMLPVQYLEELKTLPEDVISFEEGLSQRLMGKYTHVSPRAFGNHGRTFATSVNQNLTRNLSALMETFHEECKYAFETHIGPCQDWTPVKVQEQVVLMVALISGRIFIGPEMNRDPEYLRCIIEYTQEVLVAIGAVQSLRPWLRGLYCYMGWVPELNRVNESHKSMRRILKPILEQRLQALAANEELPSDMVTWNILNSPSDIRDSIKIQAHNQLQASMVAIHTTSLTASHLIYDLAARPECQKELLDEYRSTMAQEKVPYLSKTGVPKLKKLDSFCKESQRLNPLSQISFSRLVFRDITLHDGKVIPAGSHIAVAYAQRSMDPEVYKEPETFDPWRFYKMHCLHFGYGNNACPGRFFANNELKVIITYILSHYDIRMSDGEGRPVNQTTANGLRPDPNQTVLMRQKTDLEM